MRGVGGGAAGQDGEDDRRPTEPGIDPARPWPIASLVKIPLADATLERIRRGEIDGAQRLSVQPGRDPEPAPPG